MCEHSQAFQSQAFSNKIVSLYSLNNFVEAGVTPIAQIRKKLDRGYDSDRIGRYPSFRALVFQLQFQCCLSSPWLILPEIAIREKDWGNIDRRSAKKWGYKFNISSKGDLKGWQMTEGSGLNFCFAKGHKCRSPSILNLGGPPFAYCETLNKTLTPPLLHLRIFKMS